YGLGGRVIWDSAGNVLDAKYLDVDESFYQNGLTRIDSNRFLLYGSFDLYHDSTGILIDNTPVFVCFNQAGDVLWQNRYGEYAPGFPDNEEPYYNYAEGFSDVLIDSVNERLYAIGVSNSFNAEHVYKPYVVCTDYYGDTIWTWAMQNNEGQGTGELLGGIINNDGDLILIGQLSDINGTRVTYTRGLILKISSDGIMQWYRLWGEYEYFLGPISCDIIQTNTDKYLIGAIYFQCDTCIDNVGVLLEVDDTGTILNQKYITRGEYEVQRIYKLFKRNYGFDVLGSFSITDNGSFVFENLFVNKYTNNLNIISETNYGNAGDAFRIRGISQTYDGGYLFTGYDGGQNNIVMKCDSLLNLPLSEGWNAIETPDNKPKILYYPNPVKNILHVKASSNNPIKEVKIYDMFGRIVMEQYCDNADCQINVGHIKSGLYVLRVNKLYSGKLIIK
ncbi:MAG: T9SS type A sorting domain-containing protein, partial [Bacteroidales bacterium]|nr:T9SS type A sorting domain-containing protein [Bacteroidales bacterium]